MRLLSKEEAKAITVLNIRNTIIDQIMFRIENACKSGQYRLRVRDNYSKEEVQYIKETLIKLGYNVTVETQKYIGTLKTFTTISISWYD